MGIKYVCDACGKEMSSQYGLHPVAVEKILKKEDGFNNVDRFGSYTMNPQKEMEEAEVCMECLNKIKMILSGTKLDN